ncbi:lymphocyte antigen 6D [Hoplias malabaricus]|uniref:lymphocyte antigen 6D n=1 Tax=Hoplias malabaricus TaxID=27720 RepID=UPI00346248B4
MKLLLCCCLLLLLYSTTVHSLKCYTCVNGDCKTPTECPESSKFCKTTVFYDSFSQTCEEDCTAGENVYCCQYDLCVRGRT